METNEKSARDMIEEEVEKKGRGNSSELKTRKVNAIMELTIRGDSDREKKYKEILNAKNIEAVDSIMNRPYNL